MKLLGDPQALGSGNTAPGSGQSVLSCVPWALGSGGVPSLSWGLPHLCLDMAYGIPSG